MLPVTIGLGLINFNALVNSPDRRAGLRAGAARDRGRLPRLHAAPGHVQRRDRDRAVPGAQPRSPPAATSTGCATSRQRRAPRSCCCSCPPPRRRSCWPSRSRAWSTSAARSTPSRPTSSPTALIWFSLSLPLTGVNLLLTRTFFSLQRPWVTTALAGVNLARRTSPSASRCTSRSGSAGVVVGTVAGNVVLVGAAGVLLRQHARRPAGRPRARLGRRAACCSAPARSAAVARRRLVGAGRPARQRRSRGQVVAVGGGAGGSGADLRGVVLACGVPEAQQVTGLLRRRAPPGARWRSCASLP